MLHLVLCCCCFAQVEYNSELRPVFDIVKSASRFNVAGIGFALDFDIFALSFLCVESDADGHVRRDVESLLLLVSACHVRIVSEWQTSWWVDGCAIDRRNILVFLQIKKKMIKG